MQVSLKRLEQHSSDGRSKAQTIHTFFHDGSIVELPTRWATTLAREPRYSSLTVTQYGNNLKDFLAWLAEDERYNSLTLDMALVLVTHRDLQDWILKRKAAQIQGSTLRNREIAVKLFLEWLTTQESGRVRAFFAADVFTVEEGDVPQQCDCPIGQLQELISQKHSGVLQ